jgi:hypothetical protein
MARYRQSQSENRHTRPIGQAITASHIDFQPKINSGLLSGVPLEYILAYLRPSAPLAFRYIVTCSPISFFEKLSIGYLKFADLHRGKPSANFPWRTPFHHGWLSGVPLEYILAYLRPSVPLTFRSVGT